MKYRTKKKHLHQMWTTKKQREANKKLCKRYPFLIPRSNWTDEIIWDMKWQSERKQKAYSWTLAEEFPNGWWKAFGIQLCEELREDLIECNYLYGFRFVQIKSKYGQLRGYTGPLPMKSKANEIIDDYSYLSENICEHCGRPDIHMLNYGGWFIALCEDCYSKCELERKRNINKFSKDKSKKYEITPYEKLICENDDGRMADKRIIKTFSRDKEDQAVEFDLTEKANKIRAKWRIQHGENSNGISGN